MGGKGGWFAACLVARVVGSGLALWQGWLVRGERGYKGGWFGVCGVTRVVGSVCAGGKGGWLGVCGWQ